MPDHDPSTTAQSSGVAVVLFAVVGLVLLSGAVALGWKLSHVKTDVASVAPATPVLTPSPVAPPEKTTVSSVERQEVLKRIDLMPNVTAENKEQLYAYVERAQSLKRLQTVAFEPGQARVSEKETARVERASKQPPFSTMAREATAIFVVLGYADHRGDEKKNLQLSTERATSVTELLRKHCGVQSVIHTVPMGSPHLFDPKGVVENRVAEIWAVLP